MRLEVSEEHFAPVDGPFVTHPPACLSSFRRLNKLLVLEERSNLAGEKLVVEERAAKPARFYGNQLV